MRAARASEAAAEAYTAAARDASSHAASARDSQARADELGGESLRRDVVLAVSAAMRGLRKLRATGRQTERTAASAALLRGRGEKAVEQARSHAEAAQGAHSSGDVAAANKAEALASVQESCAVHIAAQASVVQERLQRQQADYAAQQARVEELKAAASRKAQLQRDAVERALEAAVGEAAHAGQDAASRIEEHRADSEAARADAQALRARAEAAGPSSKCSALLHSRAAALLEHADTCDEDCSEAEATAQALEERGDALQGELELLRAKWAAEALLPNALSAEAAPGDDSGAEDAASEAGRTALLSALHDARSACSASARDVRGRAAALAQHRSVLAQRLADLPSQDAHAPAASSSGRAPSSRSADTALRSSVAESSCHDPPAESPHATVLELIAERDAEIAAIERQAIAADAHAALLAGLGKQLRGALAAVDAARESASKRANLRGSADDLRLELAALREHGAEIAAKRDAAICVAHSAVDSGDAEVADSAMADVREALRRQCELQRCEAELAADLHAVEDGLPLDAFEVRIHA